MERWGCDFKTIDHYISEQGSLRLACKSEILVTAMEDEFIDAEFSSEIPTVFAFKREELAWSFGTFLAAVDPPPPILYFRKPNIGYDGNGASVKPFPRRFREIEDFNQNVYQLIAVAGETLDALAHQGGESDLTYKNLIFKQQLELEGLSSRGHDYFITLEERDRFERLNNPQAVDPTNQPMTSSATAKQSTPDDDAATTAITDEENPNYAGELAAAIAAWNYLYRDGYLSEGHSHSRAFDHWARTHAKGFSKTAKGRIKSVCNPSAHKNDGWFPVKGEQ